MLTRNDHSSIFRYGKADSVRNDPCGLGFPPKSKTGPGELNVVLLSGSVSWPKKSRSYLPNCPPLDVLVGYIGHQNRLRVSRAITNSSPSHASKLFAATATKSAVANLDENTTPPKLRDPKDRKRLPARAE